MERKTESISATIHMSIVPKEEKTEVIEYYKKMVRGRRTIGFPSWRLRSQGIDTLAPRLFDVCTRFLKLKLMNTDEDYYAPEEVIHMWYAYILCSKEYFALCARENVGDYGREYLHHDPTPLRLSKWYI